MLLNIRKTAPYSKKTIARLLLVAFIFILTACFTMSIASPLSAASYYQNTVRDGDLITGYNDKTLYIAKISGYEVYKRPILINRFFWNYTRLIYKKPIYLKQETLNKYRTSFFAMEVFPDGTPVDKKVYILYQDPNNYLIYKHHIDLTPNQFKRVGFKQNSIYKISQQEALFYISGYTITAKDLNLKPSAKANNKNDQKTKLATQKTSKQSPQHKDEQTLESNNVFIINIDEEKDKESAPSTNAIKSKPINTVQKNSAEEEKEDDLLEKDLLEEATEEPTAYYTSAYHNAKYYYPENCSGWKSISPSNLKRFSDLEDLLANYERSISPRCK